MNSALRKKALEEIQKDSKNKVRTGLPLYYDGERRKYDAYKIPLEYLVYNKYNGRIGSSVKSYEKQYRELNAEDDEDRKKIEQFLWESKEDRNETTMHNLVKNGQLIQGIVTNDGVIIDGNRRAMLLNRIWHEREKWQKDQDVSACRYFIAIILPEGADKRAVMRLETTYQMGEDKKLDYNPIEKYLKCKDLKAAGFKESEIAEMMDEKVGAIKEWISIMKLMDDYLDYLNYKGIYTRLEKREGQFVDLNNYLQAYEKGTSKVDWDYKKSDISDLKSICFDYIRAQYEGKEFRLIAKPGKEGSFFCNEKVWRRFRDQHGKFVDEIREEDPEDIRKENPDGDLSKLLHARDEDWTVKVHGHLKGNLKQSEEQLTNTREANAPLKLLQKAKDTLESINTDVPAFYQDPNVLKEVKDLNAITWNFQQTIKEKSRVKHHA